MVWYVCMSVQIASLYCDTAFKHWNHPVNVIYRKLKAYLFPGLCAHLSAGADELNSGGGGGRLSLSCWLRSIGSIK